MAELRETHVVKEKPTGSGATPWLAFLVGALLIAVVALFLVNARATITGPGTRIDLNVKSPVTAPANPAPAR